MNLTIDSSVFISSLLETDALHKDSRKFFTLLTSQSVTIVEPVTVLFEVANILTKAGKKDGSPLLDSFSRFHILSLDDSITKEMVFVFSKVRLTTADAIIVWSTYVSESTLVTWDRVLLREAQKLVPALTPREYLKKLHTL